MSSRNLVRFGVYLALSAAAVGCSNSSGGTSTGTAGTSGTAGTTGAAGTSSAGTAGSGSAGTGSGTSGTSGGAGTSGTAGATGAAGTGGSAGTSGAAGTSGTAGASGTAGVGAAGATGAAGSAGTAGASGAAGAGGIEQVDFSTPGMSAGCGIAPDLTGDKLPYNAMTFYKKAVSFTGKGGASLMGEYLIALPGNYAMAKPSKLGIEMGGFTRDATDCIYGDCWGFSAEGYKANAIVVSMTQINSGPLHPGQNAMPQAGWELSNELENNVAFFKAVKADILAKYCVDTKHVFVAGGSSGGDMAHYLGCWLGNEIRGIASVGGCMPNTIAPVAGKAATMPNMPTVYYPPAARGDESPANICLHTDDFSVCPGNVAVLLVHGFEDPHIPTAEARLTRDAWAVKNGCKATATPSLDSVHTMISAGTAVMAPTAALPPYPKVPNKISCGDADTCATDYPVRWCEHSEPGYDNSTHGWPSNATESPDGAGTDIWNFWNSLK